MLIICIVLSSGAWNFPESNPSPISFIIFAKSCCGMAAVLQPTISICRRYRDRISTESSVLPCRGAVMKVNEIFKASTQKAVQKAA